MTFRRPSTILSVMKDMLEVASIERLNPVCFERFEPEDVSGHMILPLHTSFLIYKLYYSDRY